MYIARPHLRVSNFAEYFGASYSRWRYKNIAMGDNTDYSSPDYDDSAWSIGGAPFGGAGSDYPGATGNSGANAYDPRFAIQWATPWPVGTRMWIRRRLTLRSVPAGGFSCVSYIEDHCKLYVNGVLLLTSPLNPVGGVGRTDTFAADKFHVGANVIAVQCSDENSGPYNGSVTFADFLFDPIP